MNISLEEKLMYDVMHALYVSGIPISFKGSMVLKACLLEMDFIEDTRHTVDIDGNWIGETSPSINQMATSIQKALEQNNIMLNVNAYRQYGEGRSAGFEFIDRKNKEVLFTMDIDVNRTTFTTKIYEIDNIKFEGVSLNQIVADKVSVISTDKIFRRIKDVIDLYYVLKVSEVNIFEVIQIIQATRKTLGNFNAFNNKRSELEHAYDKFRFSGSINKPKFEDVYNLISSFAFKFNQIFNK